MKEGSQTRGGVIYKWCLVIWVITLITVLSYNETHNIEWQGYYFFISGFVIACIWVFEEEYLKYKKPQENGIPKEKDVKSVVETIQFSEGLAALIKRDLEDITLGDILYTVELSQMVTYRNVDTCYKMFGWLDKFLQIRNIDLSSPEGTLLLLKVLGYYHKDCGEYTSETTRLQLGAEVLDLVIVNQQIENIGIRAGGYTLHLAVEDVKTLFKEDDLCNSVDATDDLSIYNTFMPPEEGDTPYERVDKQ